MKNNITELVFILDASGSMGGFEADTIGGFNSMIEKQKKLDGEVFVSVVVFDNDSKVVYDRVPISEITPMTEKEYSVGGCTALLDAVGGAVKHIGTIHKYARKEDIPEHTIFIITTDGMENASHRFSSKEVKKAIKERTDKDGWEFIFMAANIDAVETAENIGIRAERAVNYHQSHVGTRKTYNAMAEAVTCLRVDKSLDDSSWREELDEDIKKR